jgi:hypothetical protein
MSKPKNIVYRPLSGHGLYPATVVAERPDGRVDIDVPLGHDGPLHLSRIPLFDRDLGTCGVCFPAVPS